LALERARSIGLEANEDFIRLREDYLPYMDSPEAAAVVLYSQIAMAEVESLIGDPAKYLRILDEAIHLYDQHSPKFGLSDQIAALVVAMVLLNKGVRLGQLERPLEEIATYDDLVQRLGERPEPEIAQRVARALVYKGITLGQLERPLEEIATYDDLVQRLGERPEPEIAQQVARALVNKGVMLGQLERTVEALATYHQLLERLPTRDSAIRHLALGRIVSCYALLDKPQEALTTLKALTEANLPVEQIASLVDEKTISQLRTHPELGPEFTKLLQR
jgi:tetratricopeptide (TPR) repeat protein